MMTLKMTMTKKMRCTELSPWPEAARANLLIEYIFISIIFMILRLTLPLASHRSWRRHRRANHWLRSRSSRKRLRHRIKALPGKHVFMIFTRDTMTIPVYDPPHR